MLAMQFREPVCVWIGLGFPRRLNSVVDAHQFLMDWHGDSPELKAASRACKAALLGEIDAETARGVFVAFARKKDILFEDEIMPPPAMKSQPSHV